MNSSDKLSELVSGLIYWICVLCNQMHNVKSAFGCSHYHTAITVTAAASMQTALALSTLSTSSLEDVSQASDGAVRFFQLYIGRDHDAARRLIARVERAGYSAIFFTVDAPVFGKRRAHHYNPAILSSHLQ